MQIIKTYALIKEDLYEYRKCLVDLFFLFYHLKNFTVLDLQCKNQHVVITYANNSFGKKNLQFF